jgi:dihydroorotate dehydrogenase
LIYRIIKPLLFRLEAERAHDLVTRLLIAAARTPVSRHIIAAAYGWNDPILATECAGLHFPNPIGLAAGFDKRAILIDGMQLLGFGHVEVGTVTPRPQPGNPRPRMFRLPEDSALINRLGFNSPGMAAVAERLRERNRRTTEPRTKNQEPRTKPSMIVSESQRYGIRNTDYRLQPASHGPSSIVHRPVIGINIGKNRDTPLEQAGADYLAAFETLAPLADYVTLNISSPNTPGLRKLHERAALEEMLRLIASANQRLQEQRPIFLKISPDEGQAIGEVVEAGLAADITGFIATNTTLARDGLRSAKASETGGLSGQPLAAQAAGVAREIARLCAGRAPLIAVGGVFDAEDAYARIRAGATLVQIYTALVYRGPGAALALKRGLARLLRRDGFRSAAEAVGAERA